MLVPFGSYIFMYNLQTSTKNRATLYCQQQLCIFVYLVVPGRCLVKEARFGGKCTEKDANQMTPRHGGPTDPVFKIHERLIILLKKGAF